MDEGKVIIEAKDSGGVRIALRPAEDGSIWMNVREIADISMLAEHLLNDKSKRFLLKVNYMSMR